MFDIDGGLADLSAFAHLLIVGWLRGVALAGVAALLRGGQATVIELVRDLMGRCPVWDRCGVSTTRPVWYAGQSRLWFGEHGLPQGGVWPCHSRAT